MSNKLTVFSQIQDAGNATAYLRDTDGASAGSFTATYAAVGGGGRYTGTFPAVGAGLYFFAVFGNTDNLLLATGAVAWDGSAIIEPTADSGTAIDVWETLYGQSVIKHTFTGGDDTTLTSAGGLRSGAYEDCVAVIASGVLKGQPRRIDSNTASSITVAPAFSEDPIALGGTVEILILGRLE